MTRPTHCPKCDAELPRKGRFCLECGLDLYEEGLHRPPFPWAAILLGLLVVGGLAAAVALWPRGKKLYPEQRAVIDATTNLLALATRGDYSEIAERYCEPDAERFGKTGALLSEIARGSGAPGLNVVRATCKDNFEELQKLVKKYEPAHPAYVSELLAELTFENGAFRTWLGTAFGSERSRVFLAWYLAMVFGDSDTAGAKVVKAEWGDGPDGKPVMRVTVHYPKLGERPPGLPAPTVLPWRDLGDGEWTLALTDETLLQEVLDLLRRIKL